MTATHVAAGTHPKTAAKARGAPSASWTRSNSSQRSAVATATAFATTAYAIIRTQPLAIAATARSNPRIFVAGVPPSRKSSTGSVSAPSQIDSNASEFVMSKA